ncbi:MAG: MFS transporter, partial [Rikenellaceae bacterium]
HTPAEEWDGVAMPQRILAVLAVMFAVTLSVIDGVIANIALPTICEGLAIPASDSIWIINAYQIAIVVSLLPFSALGDFVGYRRIYIVGLTAFTLMSVGCALSWSFESLVICRIIQGFGASAVMSINTSMVRLIYPRHMLGRGIGLNSMVVSVSSVAGPSVAAAIMAVADWQWLFAVNLPIGVIAIVLGYLYLPENPVRQSAKNYNWGDAILNAVTFGLIFAVVTGFSHNVDWWWLVIEGVAAVVVGWIYVRSQLRRDLPILPFDLLKIPIFSLSIVTSILTFVAQMAMMVSMPFILQYQFGYSPLDVGAVITAWPAVNMVTTPVVGFMVERFHAGRMGCVGLTTLSIGLILMGFIPDDPTKFDFIWRLAICGFGFGCFQAPNNSIIISSAPLSRSGSASGMMASARLIGQITGAASVALLFYIVPIENSTNILFVGATFSCIAMVLSYARLSLPLPETLAFGRGR